MAGSCTRDAAEGTSSLSVFLLNSCSRFAASPLWGLFGEIWQGKQRVQLAPETLLARLARPSGPVIITSADGISYR